MSSYIGNFMMKLCCSQGRSYLLVGASPLNRENKLNKIHEFATRVGKLEFEIL